LYGAETGYTVYRTFPQTGYPHIFGILFLYFYKKLLINPEKCGIVIVRKNYSIQEIKI